MHPDCTSSCLLCLTVRYLCERQMIVLQCAVAVRVVTGVVVLLSKTHIQFWYFSLCCFESDHVHAGGFENTYDMLLLVRKLNTLVRKTTGTCKCDV